ncbi:MAG: class I tRNA ligase family protein, partial [Bacteroidota bacterium]|nr:class I tRNA ligase family protein [Bacteroidota bacterium]
MDYNFRDIEKKWQAYWKERNTYKVERDSSKPKYYVLDMFPYPSGAGLHVGHPLGYIASDIYARYKRLCGYNVLHPMGYDAYGLPAEQYAIQTGQHPAITTEKNISRYREQLDKIGFSFDWSREVRTCDPAYYKWTQWAFVQMFKHWYNNDTDKAEPIEKLIKEFEAKGNLKVHATTNETRKFSAEEWKAMTEKEQQETLLNYRIAYLANTIVNWCPKLGTVLANDEVKEGLSLRGGYPVIQKEMRQWSLRISAYAQRLLDGLDKIDWTPSLKEIQRNWIGRSEGAEVRFNLKDGGDFTIFTTRPDTLWGVTFMVLAPESELVHSITTKECLPAVEKYIEETKKRNERERIADTRKTGVFTGAYAIHPFNGKEIPIWVSDYVLAGYGTGAIMAVPAHDQRDYDFAKTFDLPIIPVIEGGDISTASYDAKEGKMINSGILNGLEVKEAIQLIISEIEKRKIGKRCINYRLRDAIFSRQRYWGEPFPIYYKDGIPYPLDESKLPLELPEIDAYLPTEKGEPPLGRAKNWENDEGFPLELNTMPGFAGSSAYYLRYMDPKNNKALVSKENDEYWQDVDLYIGGTEHATGHLIYSRFWNKFLFDLGIVCKDEPFKK